MLRLCFIRAVVWIHLEHFLRGTQRCGCGINVWTVKANLIQRLVEFSDSFIVHKRRADSRRAGNARRAVDVNHVSLLVHVLEPTKRSDKLLWGNLLPIV